MKVLDFRLFVYVYRVRLLCQLELMTAWTPASLAVDFLRAACSPSPTSRCPLSPTTLWWCSMPTCAAMPPQQLLQQQLASRQVAAVPAVMLLPLLLPHGPYWSSWLLGGTCRQPTGWRAPNRYD